MLPDRNNPYSFDSFLAERDRFDYYDSDPFLKQVVQHHAGSSFSAVDEAVRATSALASTRWRELANAAAAPERRPFLEAWDAWHHRIDRVVRPAETEAMEREVFSEALFSDRTDVVTRLAKLFVIYQNGEACIACPLVCTEGMVAVLDRLADRPETLAMRDHLKDGLGGRFAIGAQFLSEIQGGSDVPANRVEAVEDGGAWRLYGAKFFCSVAHADYALVTAKPSGSEDVALFAMPMWAPGLEGQRRNGLTIDRLKWKMGTCELPTAEVTLDGAVAWPVGPLHRGLANVVGIVLTLSRLTVGIASAAFMTRAVREAVQYARFREVFGRRIEEFPMAQAQLEDMVRAARRTTAAAFEVYRRFRETGWLTGGTDVTPEARRRRFDARELVMIQKFVAAEDCTAVLREAMAIFGGHGVIEDFSAIPRLFRDSCVNELWEGARNVLQAQVHRDLQRAAAWYPPGEFVASVLSGAEPGVIRPIAEEVEAAVSFPSLTSPGPATVAMCRRWDQALRALLHAFQDLSLGSIA